MSESSKYYFTRNPIVPVSVGELNDLDSAYDYTVSVGDNTYVGRATRIAGLNVADVVRSFVRPITTSAFSLPNVIVAPVLNAVQSVTCSIAVGNTAYSRSFHVIAGGISKQNYRKYADTNTDAFASRFGNPGCNFFLTTRSSAWTIPFKETETEALLYFLSYHLTSLIAKDPISGAEVAIYARHGEDPEHRMYAVSLENLRRAFVSEHNVLPAIFDIYSNGADSAACRIIIEHTHPCAEGYRLKFRNSLGVFDMVHLPGALTIKPTIEGTDMSRYQIYDSLVDDFVNERERITRKVALSLEADFAGRFSLMCDLLASDDVYLLDVTGAPLRVIPTVEELEYRYLRQAPKRVTIKLQPADDEISIMEDIDSSAHHVQPRLFSDEFEDTFN